MTMSTIDIRHLGTSRWRQRDFANERGGDNPMVMAAMMIRLVMTITNKMMTIMTMMTVMTVPAMEVL